MQSLLQNFPGIHNAVDIAAWRLCVGCGACAVACERGNIVLEDTPADGIRPVMRGNDCNGCRKCVDVCPGLGVAHVSQNMGVGLEGLRKNWGPILEIWEGHAADSDIRYHGSSGGTATAISLYCLESGSAEGVLHIGKDNQQPWRNRTVMSRGRDELLSRTGSRYSPASPCDGLNMVETLPGPCVFIGKPCDIHGLRKTQIVNPVLNERIAISVSIFCAGTPATAGTLELLSRLGAAKETLRDIRFRGNGWPGEFSLTNRDGIDSQKLTYEESWGFLQKFRPFRCYLCPDGTGELADISCGDPWFRKPSADEPGRSLVLVRTEKGREVLRNALNAGYLHLSQVSPAILELSQQNLLEKRRTIWGRLMALKAFGLPVPRFDGFPLLENWLELPVIEKARSVMGTIKRVSLRKYYKPVRRKRNLMKN